MIPAELCDPAEACCVSLYDIATHLLTEVYDALNTCYPAPDVCPPLAGYVTLDGVADGIADALTVSVTSVDASPNNRAGSMGLWRATFAVILKESGWPTARVEGDVIVLPSPSEQSSAATHVYGMGEAIHRRLSYLQSHRALVPVGTTCQSAVLGTMLPLNPQGGVAGWRVPVIVDLPWN